MRQRQRLGEDVGQLVIRRDPDETHVSVLDHFISDVLADVNVLGTLTSADYVISPFDACCIVFVDGRFISLLKSHILEGK